MNRIMRWWPSLLPALLAAALAGGCNRNDGPTKNTEDGAKYLLAKEPARAKPVIEMREGAKDGDEVVVVGHIGGDAKPWVEGRAAFWIVDPSVKACPPEENCPTPWDCCCEPKEELAKKIVTVKVVDGQGKTVEVDARQLLGLKESQTVVVHGKAKRDEQGNLTVLADGLFVRP